MTDRMEDVRRPPRGPAGRSPVTRMPGRSRRRWVIGGSVAGGWALLYIITGSLIGATALLLLLAAIGAGFVAALRLLGVTRDHPWIRGAAAGRGGTGRRFCSSPCATCPRYSWSPPAERCSRRTRSSCG